MLRVGFELRASGLIEAVYGMYQADRPGTGQIFEGDARRYAALEFVGDAVYEIESLKDRSLPGCEMAVDAIWGVAEFHFRSFPPVGFGATPRRANLLLSDSTREGNHPLAIGERSDSEGLHEGSLGKPEWRREGEGRPFSGRQAKRCPNMGADEPKKGAEHLSRKRCRSDINCAPFA